MLKIRQMGERLDRSLARIEGVMLVVALLSMMLLAFLQVLLRNFFSAGLLWIEPFVRHMVLWGGFLGASLATREKRHITVDAISKFFQGRMRLGVNVLVSGFACFVCVVLAWGAWNFVVDTYQSGEKIQEAFPTWIAQSVMPYALGVMSLRFLGDTLGNVAQVLRRAP